MQNSKQNFIELISNNSSKAQNVTHSDDHFIGKMVIAFYNKKKIK